MPGGAAERAGATGAAVARAGGTATAVGGLGGGMTGPVGRGGGPTVAGGLGRGGTAAPPDPASAGTSTDSGWGAVISWWHCGQGPRTPASAFGTLNRTAHTGHAKV